MRTCNSAHLIWPCDAIQGPPWKRMVIHLRGYPLLANTLLAKQNVPQYLRGRSFMGTHSRPLGFPENTGRSCILWSISLEYIYIYSRKYFEEYLRRRGFLLNTSVSFWTVADIDNLHCVLHHCLYLWKNQRRWRTQPRPSWIHNIWRRTQPFWPRYFIYDIIYTQVHLNEL